MAKTRLAFEIEFFSSKLPVLQERLSNFVKRTSSAVTVSLEEVSWHDTSSDCWVIIYDRVYDLTEFLEEHPGGSDILLEYAGRDATVAFRGYNHSSFALNALERYFIGELPANERIYRKKNGICGSHIPE